MNEDFFDELNNDDSYEIINVIDDDGNNIECFVIDCLKVDGNTYLLVVSSDEFDDELVEAFILKEVTTDENNVIYSPVEDDNEYNKLLILFQENNDDYEMTL